MVDSITAFRLGFATTDVRRCQLRDGGMDSGRHHTVGRRVRGRRIFGNASRPQSPRRRSGFTLIELTVVIVILAMLTAIAGLSLRGTMDRYQLSRAAETVQSFDAKARRRARLSRQSVAGTIDLREGVLTIPANENDSVRRASRFKLPRQVKIGDVMLRRKASVGSRVAIEYSDSGASFTYAIELQRGNMSRWLVILGVSGQAVLVENEGEADAILSM